MSNSILSQRALLVLQQQPPPPPPVRRQILISLLVNRVRIHALEFEFKSWFLDKPELPASR